MTSPIKMAAIQQPGFFARVWSWLGRLLRRNPGPQLADKTMVDEETVPLSLPAVISKRILPEENFLFIPAKRRWKPSMVTTTKLPTSTPEAQETTTSVAEEQEDTTRVPTPPEQMRLPLPTSLISPRGRARLLSLSEFPTTETPLEVSRDATTQQLYAPHLVNPTTGSKIVPPTLRNQSNVVVPVRKVASSLSYDEAPKTLVQGRVQDDPELMELVEEFNAQYGDSEP